LVKIAVIGYIISKLYLVSSGRLKGNPVKIRSYPRSCKELSVLKKRKGKSNTPLSVKPVREGASLQARRPARSRFHSQLSGEKHGM
jgi:hypothetical protein